MRKSFSKIVAAASPHGNLQAVKELGREAARLGVDGIALLGSLTPKGADPKEYGRILRALHEARLPAFYIPGPEDAPFPEFLREAANFEIVYPGVRGVHGTFAMAPGYVVVSGMGGAIEDDPSAEHDELENLRYPGWEVEYRLKFLHELKDYQKLFLFTAAPQHKGLNEKGSVVLAEIIKTYNPRVVLVAGPEQKLEFVGKSLVVVLGNLAEGNFTIIDFRKQQATPSILRRSAKAA